MYNSGVNIICKRVHSPGIIPARHHFWFCIGNTVNTRESLNETRNVNICLILSEWLI